MTPPTTLESPKPKARSQFIASVRANVPLCREHFKLVLRIAEHFPETEPGQFVQIACRDPDTVSADVQLDGTTILWPGSVEDFIDELDPSIFLPRLTNRESVDNSAFLRRPFSLAGRRSVRDEAGTGVEIDIIHRVVGIGTDWLSRLKTGDSVNILGPLGNRFAVPKSDELAILVGGGVGIPPMLYLAEKLAGRRCIAFCGSVTRELLPLTLADDPSQEPTREIRASLNVAEFAKHSIPSVISTDDGSCGYRGFVTETLERYLQSPGLDAASSAVVYTCGPEPMMKRVAEIGRANRIPVQIAVERAMACGMGTCQSCCIRVIDPPTADGWSYRLACTDGPVFPSDVLLW